MLKYKNIACLGSILIIVLAACGELPQASNSVTQAEPTVISAPTETSLPTNTLQPTLTPSAVPTPTPDFIPPVEIAALEIYTHTNSLFSVSIPSGWTIEEQSEQAITILLFTDPSQSAWLQIEVHDMQLLFADSAQSHYRAQWEGTHTNREVLDTFLQQHIQRQFGNTTDFQMGETSVQDDGSIGIAFRFNTPIRGIPIAFLGNGFIQQQSDRITLMAVIAPYEQFEALQTLLTAVVNSYQLLALPTPTVEQPVVFTLDSLTAYTYPTGLFSINVPASWTMRDVSTYADIILVFNEPNDNGVIILRVSDAPVVTTERTLATLLEEYLEEDFGLRMNFSMDNPQQQYDGSVGIVFTYDKMVRGVQTTMLGHGFLQHNGDLLSSFSVVVPQSRFSNSQHLLDAIINSYQISAP